MLETKALEQADGASWLLHTHI